MAKRPGAPDYFWFQPLRVLFEEGGETSPQFQFWLSLVGQAEWLELIETDSFCSLEVEEPPEWTIENFIQYGTHEVLVMYARKIMFDRFCEGGGGA